MTIEFDEKGKYFTDIVSKISTPVIIQTTMNRIEGAIHVRADERIKNELDRNEPFLAVTDATVYALDGRMQWRCDFLSVQRSQIIWVMPRDDDAKRSTP
jgi:hypothetical protein